MRWKAAIAYVEAGARDGRVPVQEGAPRREPRCIHTCAPLNDGCVDAMECRGVCLSIVLAQWHMRADVTMSRDIAESSPVKCM